MPLGFDSVPLLIVGFSLTAVAVAAMLRRRPDLPRLSQVFGLLALLNWSLALGGAYWRRGERREVLVMLDLSPSTRTAQYRDRSALARRLRELLGDVPYRIIRFADGPRADDDSPLVDMPCERTVYAPPADAARVLLFSDGRFELPLVGPPTFAVIDPNLEAPADAAVAQLQLRGDRLIADVSVTGSPRQLAMSGDAPVSVGPGAYSLARALKAGATHFSATFDAGDAWPENDGLAIDEPPKIASERWWIGPSPPAGWKAFTGDSMPTQQADYLTPAVIVLNNVAADALGTAARDRLDQYVREFGGSLVILGGDHAFGAGGYVGTPLDALSPLASEPPGPATRWVILVDGSGSMAGATAAGPSQWEVAGRAAKAVLHRLPPSDPLAIGSFAEAVTWWSNGKSVRDTAAMALPPDAVSPHGPTNLQRALTDIANAADGSMPTRIFIVTDAEATIESTASLAAAMKAKRVSLNVLAIGTGTALPALRQISETTGGQLAFALDAATWSNRLDDLARGSTQREMEATPIRLTFASPLRLPPSDKPRWNRTWLKDRATPLADAEANGQVIHPIARWQVGTGSVLAAGFEGMPAEGVALAELVALPPSDPRFAVAWQQGAQLKVTVDAVDGGAFLNGRALSLEIRDSARVARAQIPQVGPGRYETRIDAPQAPSFGVVRDGDRLLSQTAVAGRHAPEFDAIGNDHAALHELANRTGGEVIDWRNATPIHWHWASRQVSLESWLLAAGAVCLAVALVGWRLR